MKLLFLLVLCTLAFYAAGILLFTFGFLLRRIVVAQNSSCDESSTIKGDPLLIDGHRPHFPGGHDPGCPSSHPPRYRRAVLVVIDALRFDFAFNNRSGEHRDEFPYENKLVSMTEVLKNQPSNARLYRFVADPPTTTLQRLKGLTTGSLPTFVDAGANFASPEITEDNLIDQFVRLGRNVTFMGDDTWEGLFPRRFKRSFPFPSFNVKDLDTVDNGVVQNLLPEFRRGDWDLLIAHFLGVDHCGHTFGPNHQMMASKLTQMDVVIKSLMKEMTDDTILFVFGDHGMTKSGDHGGDSKEEVDAALFVYSPHPITASTSPTSGFKTLSQIDIVPTLSLLLGVPIPFSNLGSIIVDLFDHGEAQGWIARLYHQVLVLHLNAHQVHRYTEEYAKLSNDLPRDKLKQLNGLFLESERRLTDVVEILKSNFSDDAVVRNLKELKASYENYLIEVKEMCRGVWAQFDLQSMAMGLLLFCGALLLNLIMVLSGIQRLDLSPLVSRTSMWILSSIVFGSLLCFDALNETVFGVAVVFAAVVCHRKTTFSELRNLFSGHKWNGLDVIASIAFTTYILSLFSNSFVVYEDVVAAFLLLTLSISLCLTIIFSIFRRAINTDSRHGRHTKLDFSTVLIVLFLLFCIAAALRFSQYFRACREEQWSCETSVFLQPLSAFASTSKFSTNIRLFMSVASVALIVYSTYWWMRYCGNLNGSAIAIFMVSYLIPFAGIMIIFYWFILVIAQSSPNIVMSQDILIVPPRFVYFITLATLLVVCVRPLCLFLISRKKETIERQELNLQTFSEETLIPQIYNRLKMNYARNVKASKEAVNSDHDDSQPAVVVYGLATVYSSSHLVLLLTVTVVTLLLLGDGVASSVLLMWIMLFAILELDACRSRIINYEDQMNVSFISVALMFFLACEHFFSTGHQATIPAIRWEAAFHGFKGDFSSNAIPALLVTVNTFASYVLTTIALPLIIFWRYTRARWVLPKAKSDQEEKKGELWLNEDKLRLLQKLCDVFIKYILLFGFRMLATMLCVTIHRRHLMVWKIFAPRFVYEGATFLVISVVSLFVFCFVKRVDRCIDDWINKIEN